MATGALKSYLVQIHDDWNFYSSESVKSLVYELACENLLRNHELFKKVIDNLQDDSEVVTIYNIFVGYGYDAIHDIYELKDHIFTIE